MSKVVYAVKTKVWLYPGDAAWHFATIPHKTSALIKEKHGKHARGWRSIPVQVALGKSVWKTSLFPDKDVYLLPLKLSIRRAEGVAADDEISFKLTI